MNNLHAIFAQALAPFAPMDCDNQSPFADDGAEDYGYETSRQRRIDTEPDGNQEEESPC